MIREVAHQIGYLPLLWVALVVLVSAKKIAPEFVLIAAAFFVSYPWDSVVYALPIEDQFKPSYFFGPVQIWLVLLAFIKSPTHRLFSAVALVLLALVSASLHWPGPDYLITVVGSIAILTLARGRLAVPLHIYFGYGSVAYVLMAASEDILPAWYVYQSCRALAFVVFIGLLAPQGLRRWRA